jgi:hypothetical protein
MQRKGGHCESSNTRLNDECLNVKISYSIKEVNVVIVR